MEQAVGERLHGTVDVIRVFPGHVIPGRDFVPYGSFTEEDVKAVKEIDGVADVSSWMIEIAEAGYEGQVAPIELMGVTRLISEGSWEELSSLKREG
ncbi:hypothetical protein M1N15_01525 [Dehalococcoidia bacterium]|nr:hypothetical protein [Dehalococcoidia bacterium]